MEEGGGEGEVVVVKQSGRPAGGGEEKRNSRADTHNAIMGVSASGSGGKPEERDTEGQRRTTCLPSLLSRALSRPVQKKNKINTVFNKYCLIIDSLGLKNLSANYR